MAIRYTPMCASTKTTAKVSKNSVGMGYALLSPFLVWRGSTMAISNTPSNARLTMAARANLTRYHGVFAPNHPWRSEVVLQAPSSGTTSASQETEDISHPPARVPATVLARRLDWAALLQRVFAIDVLECPNCSGRMRILAFITDPLVTRRILDHLGLPSSRPRAPPRPLPLSLVPSPDS